MYKELKTETQMKQQLVEKIEYSVEVLEKQINTLNERIKPPFENGMFDLIIEKKSLEGELRAYKEILTYTKYML